MRESIVQNSPMQAIKHLYWRAGFGLSPEEWAVRHNWAVRRAVSELFEQAATPRLLPVPELPAEAEAMMGARENLAALLEKQIRLVSAQAAAWIGRMADPRESALTERMTLFWHGHFACEIRNERLAVEYLNVLRQHGLGNFRTLVLEVARTPAMIRYLNNQQNRKDSPNENFARELLELFTIGRGHYTEQDIREAARAFTGWSSNVEGTFVFRRLQHDYGSKIFMGKTGNFDGGDIIDIVLERRETAQFIVRKVYRYFVNEQVDEPRVAKLAELFYQSGYDIGKLMREIFSSDWFYTAENMGAKIKSPVEFLAGCMRVAAVTFESPAGPAFVQRALGQILFRPPNVAGWPGGKNWVDNSTLMLRLNLPAMLILEEEAGFRPKDELTAQNREAAFRRLGAHSDLRAIGGLTKGKNMLDAAEALAEYLFIRPPGAGLEQIAGFVQTNGQNYYIQQVLVRLMSMPEYQMC